MARSSDSTEHRSWRYQEPSNSVNSKSVKRWLTTLAAIVMCLLLWLLISGGCETTNIVVMTMTETSSLSIPPLPYAAEDSDPIVNIQHKTQIHDWRGDTKFTRLDDELHHVANSGNKALVLHISAQGLSGTDDKPAYLVTSQFRQDPETGRYGTQELLDCVANCKASLKLVILNTGSVVSDPRLGMAANDFPVVLAEQLEKMDDSNLWVLVSHAPFQRSEIDPASGQTIFGRLVAEALAGKADEKASGGNENQMVSLRELYTYVFYQCLYWHKDTGTPQTPWLMKAGHGLITSIEDIPSNDEETRLVWTTKPKPAELAKEDEKKTDKKKSSKKSSKKSEPPKKDPLLAQLEIAWELRDELQSREIAGSRGTSPIDFAPHLWRELNATLLDYERLYRSGKTINQRDGKENVTADVEKIVVGLRKLKLWMSKPDEWQDENLNYESIELALLNRWQDYTEKHNAENVSAFDQMDLVPTELLPLRQNLRDIEDAIFWAGDFVQWYTDVSITQLSANKLKLHQKITGYLHACLDAQQNLDGRSLVDFQDSGEELPALRYGLSADLLNETRTLLLRSPIEPRRIDVLLGTALLPAKERILLLEALAKCKPVKTPISLPKSKKPIPTGPTQSQWNELDLRVELQQKLILLARGENHYDDNLADRKLHNAIAKAKGSKDWQRYRRAGSEFRSVLKALPNRILNSDGWEQRRLLRLVDVYDCGELHDEYFKLDEFPFQSDATPTLEIRTAKSSVAELEFSSIDRPLVFPFTIRSTHRETLLAADQLLKWKIEDDKLIEFKAEPKQPPERGSDGKFFVAYEARIRARQDNEAGAKSTVLSLTPQGGRQREFLVLLPPPNRVELQFRMVGTKSWQADLKNSIQLDLFPNVATQFEFRLVNRPETKKTLKAELFAIDPQAKKHPAKTAPGFVGSKWKDQFNGDWDDERFLTEAKAVSLGKTGSISLGRDDAKFSDVLTFALPKEPAKKEGDDKDEKPEVKEVPSIVATSGMVCVISDVESDKRWIKWINPVAMQPRDYLKAQIFYESGQVHFAVDHKTDFGDGPKSPQVLARSEDIPIEAMVAGSRFPGTMKAGEMEPVANTSAVNRTELPKTVVVTVDKFDRAFEKLVDVGADKDYVERAKARIRIASVANTLSDTVFHLRGPLPKKDKDGNYEDGKKHVLVKPDKRGYEIVLSSRRGLAELQVGIQADEPNLVRDPEQELIQLRLPSEEEPVRLFATRDTTVTAKTEESGAVNFEAMITDWVVPLKITSDRPTKLIAKIQSTEALTDEDEVSLLFDRTDPKLLDEAAIFKSSFTLFYEGRPFEADISVEEDTGISHIEFGFVKPGDAGLKPDAKSVQKNTDWEKRRFQLNTVLPAAGEYEFLVQAFDRAGFPSKFLRQKIVVKPATDLPGVIHGQVFFPNLVDPKKKRFPNGKVTVVISGNGTSITRTFSDKGKFLIKESGLRIDKQYNVVATTIDGNTKYAEAKDVTPDAPDKLENPLELPAGPKKPE